MGTVGHGPVLIPGKVYDWSLVYVDGGLRRAARSRVTSANILDAALRKGTRPGGADRFGLFTSNIGGQIVQIYLDDLTYSCRSTP